MFTRDAVLLSALALALAIVALAARSKDPAEQRFYVRCFFGHVGGLLAVLTIGQPLAAMAALVVG